MQSAILRRTALSAPRLAARRTLATVRPRSPLHSRSAPPRHHRTRSSSPLTYLYPSHTGPARHVDVQADGPGRDQADGVERAQDGRKGGGPRVGVAVAGVSPLSRSRAVSVRLLCMAERSRAVGGCRRGLDRAPRADAPPLLPLAARHGRRRRRHAVLLQRQGQDRARQQPRGAPLAVQGPEVMRAAPPPSPSTSTLTTTTTTPRTEQQQPRRQ